jgi:hypothetical protein
MEWVTVYVVAQLLPIYLTYFKDDDFYYNSITNYSNNDSVAERRALHEESCLLLAKVITPEVGHEIIDDAISEDSSNPTTAGTSSKQLLY